MLHATQRTLDILVDNTAEAQKGILPQRDLLPTYLMPEEQLSPVSSDTILPIPLGKGKFHPLNHTSDVLPRGVWICEIDTISAQENI